MADELLNRDNFFSADVQEKWFGDEEQLDELLGICFPRGQLDPAQLPPERFDDQDRNFLLNMADMFNLIGQQEAPPIEEQVQDGAAVAGEGENPEEAEVAGEEEVQDDQVTIEEWVQDGAAVAGEKEFQDDEVTIGDEIPEAAAVAGEEEVQDDEVTIGDEIPEAAAVAVEEEVQDDEVTIGDEIPEAAAVAGEEEVQDDEVTIGDEICEAAAVVEEEAAQVEEAPAVNVADVSEFPPLMRYGWVSKKERRGEFRR